jgi:acetyl esterase/lipase
MLRWFFLLLAFFLGALSLLTVVEAPDWVSWKLALLAGQFGSVLVPLALGAGLMGWLLGSGLPARLALLFGVVGGVLFAMPGVEAWWIGRSLPATLAREFGPSPEAGRPFSLAALYASGPVRVKPVTLSYPGVQPLDFYRAARPAAPVVVVIHGGGWDNGERGQIPELNYWLVSRGYAVADISYRLAPAAIWPAQRADVLAAIAALKGHAATLGLDPARIVVFGRSAGGQIAEAVAYGTKDPAIRGVVGFYAPADMNFAYAFGREDDILKSPQLLRQFLGGAPATAQAAYDSASGILSVSPASPPTLLVHGQLDTLVWHRQSERLAKRLGDANVPRVFLSLPWSTHALEYHLASPGGQLSTFALAWFLQAVTKSDHGRAGPP